MQCEYCEKIFSNISSLNNHKKTAKYCLKIQNEKGFINCSKEKQEVEGRRSRTRSGSHCPCLHETHTAATERRPSKRHSA